MRSRNFSAMGCCFSSNVLVPLPRKDGAQERTIVFTKKDNSGLGMQARANIQDEAVVFEIHDGGMAQIWNHRNPRNKVTKGDRIVSVNGVISFWPMVFELQSQGTHVIVVRDGSLDDFVAKDAAKEQEEDTTAPDDLVESFPLVAAAECADKECSICLDVLSTFETNVQFPCHHCFHKACAESWLAKGRSICPVCRAPLTSDSVDGSEQSTEAV